MPKIDVRRTVATPHAPIHVYGFMHGMAEGQLPHREVSRSLEGYCQKIGDDEYVMIEGPNEEHFKGILEPEEMEGMLTDHFKRVFSHIGAMRLHDRAERPEFGQVVLETAIDPHGKLDLAYHEQLKEEAESVEAEGGRRFDYSRQTFPGLRLVEESKKGTAEAIARRLKGAGRAQVDEYVESTTSFRSLLIARAAFHRAQALGKPVHVMAGFLHSDEIERFVASDESRAKYLNSLQPRLKAFYRQSEVANQNITLLFHRFVEQNPTRNNPRFLRALAHKVQAEYTTSMITGRMPNLHSITPQAIDELART